MKTSSLSLETVLSAIENTASISKNLAQLTPVSQEWSASQALHFQAVHCSTQVPVQLKVGISPNELFWTEEVSHRAPYLVPTLFLSGNSLDGFPLAWKAVEIAQGGVLGPQWAGREFAMLLEAGVEFQVVMQPVIPPPDRVRLETRTCQDVYRWLQEALPSQPPGPVQALIDRLDGHFSWVEAHCETVTCHGDLHMCNGVTRTPPPEGKVLLIDFAVCRQPWAFEAARLQVLNSLDPSRPGFRNLVHKMADVRQRCGLSTCSDLDSLSRITLAWYAVQMWHLIPERRPDPAYRKLIHAYIRDGANA
jgi:hypothetical protein